MIKKSRFSVLSASFLLAALVLTVNPTLALATTIGPSAGSAFANATSGTGSVTWANPANAQVSDTSYAVASFPTLGGLSGADKSQYLQATGFNFAIPSGAIINGIQVNVTKKASGTNVNDNRVSLLKGGVIQTTDKKVSTDWPTSDAVTTYGSVSDLWGSTWTATDINAANFGIAFSAKGNTAARTASINYITITVTYTATVGTTPQTITVSSHAPASAVYGSTFPVAASASSALPVAITTTGGCSIAAGIVTMTSGTTACVVHYNQAGDTTFAPATEILETTTATKKPIGVTADAKSKVAGAADPSLTYQITTGALVGSDTLTGALTRVAGESAGTYAINQGTLGTTAPSSNNYTITYTSANLTITAAAPACNLVYPTNTKIQNPCLDADTNPTPTNWAGDYTSLVPVPQTSPLSSQNIADAHSSTRAAKVEIGSYTSGDAKWVHAPVGVQPNDYYNFGFFYKASAGSTVGLYLRYNNSDASGAITGFHWLATLPATSGNWTSYTTHFTVPAGVTQVQVIASLESLGTLITDDYALTLGTAPLFPEGRVTLSFDDGWKSFYDNARPILNLAGLKSTEYIITGPNGSNIQGAVGTTTPEAGYMSLAEIQQLQLEGNDIAAHTRTHPDLTLLDSVGLDNEINGSRQDLLTHGIATVNSFAYPLGATNAAVESAVVRAGFTGARGIENFYNDTSTNKFNLGAFEIFSSTTVPQIRSLIGQATSTRTWLVLFFHKIEPNCGVDPECVTTAYLQSVVDYLKVNNTCVLTVSQVLTNAPCNLSPVLDPIGAKSIAENNILTFTAHAVDGNAGDVLAYSLTTAPATATINPTTGVFSWTPGHSNVGTTSVTVLVSDGHGGTDSETIVVTITPDLTPPTVTLSTTVASTTNLSSIPITVTFSEVVIGFTQSDIASSTTGGTVSGFTGTGASYSLNVNPTVDGPVSISIPAGKVQDLATNQNTASNVLLINSDRTKPVISLVGLSVINLTTADTYLEQGATTTDNFDTNVPVIITGVVDTATPGTYAKHYNATDTAGNHADEVVRLVNVSDQSAPVFSNLPESVIVEATSPDGATVDYTLPTANDDVDGSVLVTCYPLSGDTYPLGITVVACSAEDAAGNQGAASFPITVRDATAPVMIPPVDQTFEATGALTTPTLELGTATDVADLDLVITYAPISFPVGTTTVTWTATDDSLNESISTTSIVTITDTTAPEITGDGELTIKTGEAFSSPVTAFDLVDGDLTGSLVISGDAVNNQAAGTYTVIYNVTDSHGNAAIEKSLIVTVSSTALPPGRGPAARSSGGGGGGRPTSSTASTTGTIGGGLVLGSSTFKFTLTTTVGSTGNEVTELQKRLTSEGVYQGPITGYFGFITQAGVKSYQIKNGISPVGIVGPQTRLKLNGDTAFTPDFSKMTPEQLKSLIQSLQAQLADLMKKVSKN